MYLHRQSNDHLRFGAGPQAWKLVIQSLWLPVTQYGGHAALGGRSDGRLTPCPFPRIRALVFGGALTPAWTLYFNQTSSSRCIIIAGSVLHRLPVARYCDTAGISCERASFRPRKPLPGSGHDALLRGLSLGTGGSVSPWSGQATLTGNLALRSHRRTVIDKQDPIRIRCATHNSTL